LKSALIPMDNSSSPSFSGAPLTPLDFKACTRAVRVDLRVSKSGFPPSVDLEVDAESEPMVINPCNFNLGHSVRIWVAKSINSEASGLGPGRIPWKEKEAGHRIWRLRRKC
jgi:hypothetical protein